MRSFLPEEHTTVSIEVKRDAVAGSQTMIHKCSGEWSLNLLSFTPSVHVGLSCSEVPCFTAL